MGGLKILNENYLKKENKVKEKADLYENENMKCIMLGVKRRLGMKLNMEAKKRWNVLRE